MYQKSLETSNIHNNSQTDRLCLTIMKPDRKQIQNLCLAQTLYKPTSFIYSNGPVKTNS